MQGIALPGKSALLSVSALYALAFNVVAEESVEINFDASFLRLGNGQSLFDEVRLAKYIRVNEHVFIPA
ncbi:TPA: hypothetical protein ACHF2V_004613 [Citrobacter farmeri]|uniref:hypothetical protein n=1 Tax=Citrobacter farmeri TaxID=67824 RepID=UPI00050F3655|nr:hypothetical protein [Citrobacter farmeri]QXA99756.1 hypothetical protein I6L53_17010 [Citrobacter farmeri]GAL51268.1 hypothetical protein CIFAM_17_02120 [Citrobacter farmeri GTC 1319]